MRKLTLGTQFLLVLVLLQLYFLGLGSVYWVYSNAQFRLNKATDEDLAIAVQLPRLHGDLLNLHMRTARYLLTGNTSWLQKREQTLDRIRGIQRELSVFHLNSKEQGPINDLYHGLSSYLIEQDHWINLKKQQKLSLEQATRIIGKDSPLEALIETSMELRNVNVADLRIRRSNLHHNMSLAFFLALASGFIANVLLAFFVSRFITGPIQELEKFASNWELDKPWNFQATTASYEVSSLISCMREMSQRLNSQYRQIAELEHIKSQLVAMISHEFNNALTVVFGILTLLQESEERITERRTRYYDTLKSNLRSLSIISTNLLNMGRLESGHFAVNPRRIEVRGILQSSLERLEILYKRKNLRIFLELPEKPVPVKADPEALSLVIMNLLSNAIKYTPDSGSISTGVIRESGVSDRLQIYVQDTGIGIPSEDISRIFAGYYRTDSSKKAAKGFGVGLLLAKMIVEAHQSSLQVESEPGKGSRFFFTLPVWHDPVAPI